MGEPVSTTVSEYANNFEKKDDLCVIEANIDDMTPEMGAFAVLKLLSLGAMDAWLTPIIMKKGRAAFQLHVVCKDEKRNFLISHIFQETTTIGVRYYSVMKTMLEHRTIQVDTRYGSVGVKVAFQDKEVLNIAPEFEECRRQSEHHEVPLKEVYRAALVAYERLNDAGS